MDKPRKGTSTSGSGSPTSRTFHFSKRFSSSKSPFEPQSQAQSFSHSQNLSSPALSRLRSLIAGSNSHIPTSSNKDDYLLRVSPDSPLFVRVLAPSFDLTPSIMSSASATPSRSLPRGKRKDLKTDSSSSDSESDQEYVNVDPSEERRRSAALTARWSRELEAASTARSPLSPDSPFRVHNKQQQQERAQAMLQSQNDLAEASSSSSEKGSQKDQQPELPELPQVPRSETKEVALAEEDSAPYQHPHARKLFYLSNLVSNIIDEQTLAKSEVSEKKKEMILVELTEARPCTV